MTPYQLALKNWIRTQNFRDSSTGKYRKPTAKEIEQFSAEWKAKQSKAKKKPKHETLLQKLEREARARKLDKHSQSSYNWFKKRVRTVGGDRARDAMLDDARKKRRLREAPTSGKMYTYIYDAKYKDKLPYWDAFPLIFMIGPAKGGFYGINLHYLAPRARAQLFDALLSISNTSRYNANTKIKLSYDLLKGASKYKLFKPCFKHYLFDHLQSKLALIPADEWEAALFMPTANFQGANNSKVWSDSILKVT